MKPAIRAKHLYTFILMRDDTTKIHSIRLTKLKLSVYTGFFVLLCLCVIASTVFAKHYYSRYTQLQEKYATQSAELKRTKLELEHLANVKQLVASSPSPSLPQNTEIGSFEPEKNSTAKEIPEAENQQHTTLTTPSEAEALSTDSPELITENSPVAISNFSFKFPLPQRLHISYNIATQEQKPASGSVSYFGKTEDGSSIPLTATSKSSTRFSINYMKHMNGTFKLPQDYSNEDIVYVEIIIALESGETFRGLFPLNS